jgi:hypothetical protein
LGPAHSRHDEIATLGYGRFSHWGEAIAFSTSDNTDANSNGRIYWAVVPPPVQPGDNVALPSVFSKFGEFGFVADVPQLNTFSDSVDHPTRSHVIVYEDGHPLGPPHSLHAEIATLGRGRFSHWGDAIAFSTSDNTDPNSNGRRYWATLPKD